MTLYELLLPTVGRWLGLAALAILVGNLVVDLLVLPRQVAGLASARRRLRRWTTAAIGVLIVTSAGDLIVRARTMSGGDLSQAIAALPLVLARTHFGAIWIGRVAALALLVIAAVSASVTSRAAGLVLSVAVVLSLSLTGHAADWGDYSFSVLVDWLHALAATSWTGGLFALVLTLRDRPPWRHELVGVVARRFSRLAGYCLLAVVATGIYNAWAQLPSVASLWTTAYGAALLLKIALALLLAALGAVNRYRVLPALDGCGAPPVAATTPAVASKKLLRLVALEALLAVFVLGCTAVLAESTPKRHQGHDAHAACDYTQSIRVIFFDAGNTLLRMDYAAMAVELERHGVHVTPGEVQHAEWLARVRLDDQVFARAAGASTETQASATRYMSFVLEGLGVADARVLERVIEWRNTYNPPVGVWSGRDPQALEALELVRRSDARAAAISNSNGMARSMLTAVGLGPYLDFVIDSREVGVEKPDPRIFELAVAQAGVVADEAAYIGDFYSIDVRGAAAAGLRAVLLDPGGFWGVRDCAMAPDLLSAVRLALSWK